MRTGLSIFLVLGVVVGLMFVRQNQGQTEPNRSTGRIASSSAVSPSKRDTSQSLKGDTAKPTGEKAPKLNEPMPIYVEPYYNVEDETGQLRVNVGKHSVAIRDATPESIKRLCLELRKKHLQSLTPECLFVIAIRLYDLGHRDDSIFWFYLAQHRMRVLHLILEDLPANSGADDAHYEQLFAYRAFFQLVGPYINKHAYRNPDLLATEVRNLQREAHDLSWVEEVFSGFSWRPKEVWVAKQEEVNKGLVEYAQYIKQHGRELQFVQEHGEDAANQRWLKLSLKNPKFTDPLGRNGLHIAIELKDKDSFMALLKAGADINQRNENGMSVLDLAAETVDIFWLEHALEHDCDLNQVNERAETALWLAIGQGLDDHATLLIQNGADINYRKDYPKNKTKYSHDYFYPCMVQHCYGTALLLLKKGLAPQQRGGNVGSLYSDASWLNREKAIERMRFSDKFSIESLVARYDELLAELAKRNLLSQQMEAHTSGGGCGLIRGNAKNLIPDLTSMD